MNFNNVAFERAIGTAEQFPPSDLPEICFSGRSNVGKSSLINRLVGRKALARISSRPGKTVTVNFYRLDGFRLVDLPGYGYARVAAAEKERWAAMMNDYFTTGRNIKTVFQLIDMRHAPSADDMDMLRFLCEAGYPFTVVLTKSDTLNKTAYAERKQAVDKELFFLPKGTKIIVSSAEKGEGTDELKKIIEKVCGG